MEELSQYKCQTPVVFIIFNRPEETRKTLMAIKKVEPKQLFVIADGPREWVPDDKNSVRECRDLLMLIDWECDVVEIFSEENLGCMRRIITGLDMIFKSTDRAIILEDDCVPSVNFFRFTEWGLNEFRDDPQIGMISGSNLISHKHKTELRNGFSRLINIWGWATWKSVWVRHNQFLSIQEVQKKTAEILRSMNYNWWQSMFWRELFKYTVYAGSTWDFQLQYTFFKLNLFSVYPRNNLINNIGFRGNGTHTNINEPEYIVKNTPDEGSDVMDFSQD